MNTGKPQPFRLAQGGLVDRDQPIGFHFDGRFYQGYAGDSLASALLANGARLVARSYKLHRPRGIYSAGEEEPTGLVETGAEPHWTPNCRAPQVRLVDGLEARSQLGWPSLRFDLGRWVDYSHRFWPAGFYNKTFKWPRWKTWEPLLRRMAGLGRAPREAGGETYEQVHLHCDLLVCGAGPAGLAAALVAARAGLRVMLVEQDGLPGGSLLGERSLLDGLPGATWAAQVTKELQVLPKVDLLFGTTLAAVYDGPVVTLAQANADGSRHACLWTVRPRRILLAGGAIEQGLVFPGNDRPGIMLASALRVYLNRYAVAPGRRLGLACNNDSAWQTALDWAASGLGVAFIADSRARPDAALTERARQAGIEVLPGATVRHTLGDRGLRAVELNGPDGGGRHRRACDLLAVSGGWAPRVHTWCHARGPLRFDQDLQCFLPTGSVDTMSVAGSAAGVNGLLEVLRDGGEAAAQVVAQLGGKATMLDLPSVSDEALVARHIPAPQLTPGPRRQWLDLLHDVTLDDAVLAVREGFTPVEHFKRFTTTGMAADQGKTGNLNAFMALGALSGRAAGEVGLTTFRPPYAPLSLGALAGRVRGEGFAPRRYLPAHQLHLSWGALMADYGWQRPDAYLREGESVENAIQREVLTVRQAVGVFDNSPIGKIEVRGADAARFLDRFYINDVLALRPGRARYGLMLNENGVVLDDGIILRLADDHFLLNTSSAHATLVCDWLEQWAQCEWPGLEVVIDDVTDQWACFTVAGPAARAVVQSLCPATELAAAALPHMAVMETRIGELPTRIARVSFSGELSFEISVPSLEAAAVLGAIATHGQKHGLAPYGIEALMSLRLEKGYFHVGTDGDGASSPDDLGWGDVARNKRRDYIGRRSLDRPANRAPGRKQLVGVEPLLAGGQLRVGGHFCPVTSQGTDGWITSSAFSPSLQRWIGLGMLVNGRSRLGETVTVRDGAQRYPVRITTPCFVDPKNERLHG